MATLSTSSFWILTVLADGSRHGYQIMQEVSNCSFDLLGISHSHS